MLASSLTDELHETLLGASPRGDEAGIHAAISKYVARIDEVRTGEWPDGRRDLKSLSPDRPE